MWSAKVVLACALNLLGRSADSLPPVAFVNVAPADVSSHAEAYVRVNDSHIFLLTSGPNFVRLQRGKDLCGDLDAARQLASVLVHEEAHLKYGADERQAYQAQLTTLAFLGAPAGTRVYSQVFKSMQRALAQPKPRPDRIIVLR